MLLIKQALISILKYKLKIFILIILIFILSLLSTTFYITIKKLNEANKFMGFGTFNYNYSYKYISSNYNTNYIQTIVPWYHFNIDYSSYEKYDKKEYYPTLTIGKKNSSLQKIALTNKNFIFTKNKNNKIIKSKVLFTKFNDGKMILNNVKNGEFGALYKFNFNAKTFQNSVIGKIYKNYIFNKKKDFRQKKQAIKLLENYMNLLNNSQLTFSIQNLINSFINKNNDKFIWDEETIIRNSNNFINGVNDNINNCWDTKILNYSTNVPIIDFKNNQQDDILTYNNFNEKWGMRGNIGLIVQNKYTKKYQYYFNNLFYLKQNSEINENINNFTTLKIRNLESSDFFDIEKPYNGKRNKDFIIAYFELIAFLTNFENYFRDQTVVWTNTGLKFRFIPYWYLVKQKNKTEFLPIYDNEQLKIIQHSIFWDNLKGMNETVIISPQFAKFNNLQFDSIIQVGQNQKLYIGAFGGDTQNIYPTIFENDIISDFKTQAILYISHYMYKILFCDNSDIGYLQESFQDNSIGFLRYYGQNQKQDYDNFKIYLMDNLENLKETTNYLLNNKKGKIKRITIFNTYETNKNINLRYHLLNKIIKIYSIFSFFFILIFLIIIFSINFVLLKKILEKQKSQIGILKAHGYSSIKIGFSYITYIIICLFIGVPFGWVSGLFLQTILINIFNNYFVIPMKFNINFFTLLCLIIVFTIVIYIIMVLFVCNFFKKNVLFLLHYNKQFKTNFYLQKIIIKNKFKKFINKFKIILISVSFKNMMLCFWMFLIITMILTFFLLIPIVVFNFNKKYYGEIYYNNEFNYNDVEYNNPLSRYYLYNFKDNMSDNLFFYNSYSTKTINPFAEYIKKNGKFESIITIDSKQYQQLIQSMLLYNISPLKGVNISLEILDYIAKNSPDKKTFLKVSEDISFILCNLLPMLFDQSIIFNIPVHLSVQKKWQYCIDKITNHILPSEIKELWYKNKINKQKFSFGFGILPYNNQTDKLFTGYKTYINKINNIDYYKKINIDTYGIINSNLNLININNNNIFKYKKNNKNIPILINQSAHIKYNINIGDIIDFSIKKQAIQYLGKNKNNLPEYYDIDPNWWSYNQQNKGKIYSMNLSKFTYSEQNNDNNIWGYQDDNGKIIPYNKMSNILLTIPKNKIDVNVWNKEIVNISGSRNEKYTHLIYLQTNDGTIDAYNNNVIIDDGKNYIIKIYDLNFDHKLNNNLSELISAGFPTNWYSSAIKLNIFRTTTKLQPIIFDEITENEGYKYYVVDIQNTYDKPRIFLDQRYANKVLKFPIDINKNNVLNWFNGKYVINSYLNDLTQQFIFSSPNNNYSILSFSNNFRNALGEIDYIFLKKQILTKLTNIIISLFSFFTTIIIIISTIVILLITDIFFSKYVKLIFILKIQGYSIKEINNILLTIFIPFILIAWILGFFSTWIIMKFWLKKILLDVNFIISMIFPYILLLKIIFMITLFIIIYIFSIKKILSINISLLNFVK